MTQADANVELKPCAHCGKSLRKSSTGRAIWWHPGVVTDDDCPFAGRGISTIQIAAWNTRVEPTLHPFPSAVTPEMIEAGLQERDKGDHLDDSDLLASVYAAMQRSTPTAPVQGDDAELIARQFERLKQVEDALANGAHRADDPECHPLYPQAVAARQILEKHCSRLSGDNNAALVEALRTAQRILDDEGIACAQIDVALASITSTDVDGGRR